MWIAELAVAGLSTNADNNVVRGHLLSLGDLTSVS